MIKQLMSLGIAATALAAGVTGLTAGTADAASGCRLSTGDEPGNYWCYNKPHVYVYAGPDFGSGFVGWLDSSWSYFYCVERGGPNARDDLWLLTDSDTGGSGFIPATEVYDGGWGLGPVCTG